MKKIVLITTMLFASVSFAQPVAYVCTVISNPSKTALVAGDHFKMLVDDSFGINTNYNYPIRLESAYLGICEGNGSENNNPLAEGWTGSASVSGTKCAADGFEVFTSAGIIRLIQINEGSEAVFYSCKKIINL